MNLYYITLFKILKKYINKIVLFENNQYYVYIDINTLFDVVFFLKNSLLFKINSLVDITAIDWIWRLYRFTIYYNLFSFLYNTRVFILLDVPVYYSYIFGFGVESITLFFPAANWLEREVWDLFGVFFYNHIDLRRILTDYGFTGFPFRKDFPLSGYKEIRYDDVNKVIIFETLKLTQEFRAFAFINPWI